MGFTEVILTCLKTGACVYKHITNASHNDSKIVRGNERRSYARLLNWHGFLLVCSVGYR